MKKSTIYEIAIRIIGIYALTLIVYQLVAALDSAVNLVTYDKTTDKGEFGIVTLLIGIAIFIMIAIIPWYLLFRTQWIVKKICPPEDFEENVSLFAEPKVIYEIAIMVAGILLIIWSLPDFVLKFINYLNMRRTMFPANDNFAFLQTYVAKIIIGAIAIAYANPIAAYFARRTKNIPRD